MSCLVACLSCLVLPGVVSSCLVWSALVLCRFGSRLGSFWVVLGVVWHHFGVSWGRFGGLERSWEGLGGVLGASWASWGGLESG